MLKSLWSMGFLNLSTGRQVATVRSGGGLGMVEFTSKSVLFARLRKTKFVVAGILLASTAFCWGEVESKSSSSDSQDETNAESSSESEQGQDQSPEQMEEITIVAHPLSAAGVRTIADIDVISLEYDNLERVRSENLADVVSQVSGVRNSSYGSGSAHPIIHGLDGPRILLLYDRLRPMDVATTPGDHPPLVEPFVANRIEILKGPNTLLFGSGASGGVINTETGRIPRGRPAGGSEYGAEVRSRDNGSRSYAAGHIDFALEEIVVHLDGFSRSADSYDIPGCALSDRLIEQREAEEAASDEPEEEEEHHEEEIPCGTLPNSDVENQGGSLGLSMVRDWGFAGFSYATSQSAFGIPVEHEHHEEHEEEGMEDDHADDVVDPAEEMHEDEEEEQERVHIDLEYSRFDWEVGLDDPFEYVQSLNWRIGFSDYSHDELEADVPVTSFNRSDAIDSRLVITTPKIGEWTNAIGFQLNNSEFSFKSEGGHAQPISTQILGMFWVGHTEHNNVDYQVGLRLENITVEHEEYGKEDYSLLNASGGFAYPISDELTFDASLDFSSRAPLADELFVEGVHLATGSHLEANPSLSSEDIRALNVSLEYESGPIQAAVASYVRWTDSFIYDTPTGEIEDGRLVYQYRQNDATIFGTDVTLEYDLYRGGNWIVDSLIGYDFVNSDVDIPGNDMLPREPANRLVARLEALRKELTIAIAFEHHAEVDDTADFILPTDAYTDVSLDVEYTLNVFDIQGKVFLQCKNLMDSEQRPHTSPIKDAVPLPGRSIEIGFRVRN